MSDVPAKAIPALKKFYWTTEHLVLVGIFSALIRISGLAVSLVGGGPNPIALFIRNGLTTALLVVLVCRVRKFGVLCLYCLINVVISFFMSGSLMIVLAPANLLAAILSDWIIAATGGYKNTLSVLVGVAMYDLFSRGIALGMSFVFLRENAQLFAAGAFMIALGYCGSVLVGLPAGYKFVKELRHAGLIRER
ncbi:MAG: MptD family putative ECF transporter S component [Opitutales bacterium]|nr:MptD family putative ECF transporter S component [Opitutales bacterium]